MSNLIKRIIKKLRRPAKRILLVDDEEGLLRIMKLSLASMGYDVVTALNGRKAIDLIKKDAPDVVILDIMMPEMDGVETLRQIREFNKKIPVLMLTAYADEHKFAETDKLNIAGFIQKGTGFNNALGVIRVVLKGVK